jgi:hypothetical protein
MIDTTAIFLTTLPPHNPMKTKIILSLAIALTAPLLSQRIFADITYKYTGNQFTDVVPPYTMSDSVTGSVTFALPLAPNMPLTDETASVTAFSLSDGVQTITDLVGHNLTFGFATANGFITNWEVDTFGTEGEIVTRKNPNPPNPLEPPVIDLGVIPDAQSFGQNIGDPGVWSVVGAVSDTGSTLSLMTLTLMALGLVARRFKRAAC